MQSELKRFGPMLLVEPLGRGGMGEVFIARAPWTGHPLVAVKRLRRDVAELPTFADRFRHEAEICVRLEHLNIVETLDVGSVDGELYVASELIFGKDAGVIADRLRERGLGGPAAVAIRIAIDALAGLAYVHGATEPDGTKLDLVHRDITPGNLLIGYDGVSKLADFGLAKSHLTRGNELTRHGEILGTPQYLAPELVRGEPASPASDIYGLGAVLYRFLTGIPPHQGTTAELLLKVLQEEPRSLASLRPDLAPWLAGLIHRMLTKDRRRRPDGAAELLRELTSSSRASALFVPRAAVGRWLERLFEDRYEAETEARERMLSIELRADEPERVGTVVLARPSLDTVRLRAPIAIEEHEGPLTEIEQVGGGRHRRPGGVRSPRRGQTPTQRGRPAPHPPERRVSDAFKATLLSRPPARTPTPTGTSRFRDPAEPRSPPPVVGARAPITGGSVAAYAAGFRPGFLDGKDRLNAQEPTALELSSAELAFARSQGPEFGRPSWTIGEGQPVIASGQQAALPDLMLVPPSRVTPRLWRSLSLLILFLGLAVASGIGIGHLASRMRESQRVDIEGQLRVRWTQVEARVEERRAREDRPLDPELELRFEAARSALEAGRLDVAAVEVTRVERLLEVPD